MTLAQDFLKKIPQYTRGNRHMQSVIHHGTPRKWSNLVRVEWDRKRRAIELKSHPYLLIVDPCNFCNLKCPLCPTGIVSSYFPATCLACSKVLDANPSNTV